MEDEENLLKLKKWILKLGKSKGKNKKRRMRKSIEKLWKIVWERINMIESKKKGINKKNR